MKTDTFSNHLRWVILLLAAAVILPTVCLLWFMNQAVINERLAVRSKLIDVYQKQYEVALQNHLDETYIGLNISMSAAEGILIYGPDGKLTFPVIAEDNATEDRVFSSAITFEHQQNRYDLALNEYEWIAETADDPHIRTHAQISQARCLAKLKRNDEAIEMLETVIKSSQDDIIGRTQKCRAYLLLMELRDTPGKERLMQFYDFITPSMKTDNELQYLGESDYQQHSMDSGLQALALVRFADYAGNLPSNPDLQKKIKRAEKLASIIFVSLEVAQDYPEPDFIESPGIVSSAVFPFETQKPYYGRYRRARGFVRTLVFSRKHLTTMMNPLLEDISQMPARCAIYDNAGQWIAGIEPKKGQESFIKMPISDWLPGWTAHLYVQDATFEDFANRQAILYTWAGFLVIGFILLSIGMVTTAIVKQQKMNRLKNNFIATVTHELKTPLSSMRVLVDTLLEKRYDDEKTATEYLQLVANENKRLTHLIDSFLTFSRMERNKQVFDLRPVAPAEISTEATEAMHAKLHDDNCAFTHTIEDNLPLINADKDAIVTVLVNLLDNAYKYTNHDKQIELNVYPEQNYVCFAVKDNGIGMSPGARRKIFNRFYQVDSRLSRRSEGCGLGLSIVKFIVDAHKGKIEVQSTPCRGSIFTIKLPRS